MKNERKREREREGRENKSKSLMPCVFVTSVSGAGLTSPCTIDTRSCLFDN